MENTKLEKLYKINNKALTILVNDIPEGDRTLLFGIKDNNFIHIFLKDNNIIIYIYKL